MAIPPCTRLISSMIELVRDYTATECITLEVEWDDATQG